jgi:UDP-N-acetylmuramate--alanine ligase
VADELELGVPSRLHVLNAGGAGMSAVATLLAEMGHRVSGDDPNPSSPFLPPLRRIGVELADPGRPLDGDVDAVVVSTATSDDHPHLVEARRRGIPVVHRSGALAAICRLRRTVAVAGTHGKTTTSALLASILAGAGSDPGWVVGAAVPGLGRSSAWGGDGALVVEADESDGTFLALGAHDAVVTNLEPDHLEHWGSAAALRGAFERFVGGLAGSAVLCADDEGSMSLRAHAVSPVVYGCDEAAPYRISSISSGTAGVGFELHHDGDVHQVWVPGVPGAHNATNAAGALAAAHRLGVPLFQGVEVLRSFRGVGRRFEQRGEGGGVLFVDDYAHLPTEVAAAIDAARTTGRRRVVCAFQPHRFSRTEALGHTFADAFTGADLLCLTDVYPAGEEPRPGVSGRLVLEAVLDAHPWARVAYLPSLDDVVAYLRTSLRPGDLCLTLGAGDLTTVPDRLLDLLGAEP